MQKIWRRSLSLFMAFVMVFGMLPVQALAEDSAEPVIETTSVTETTTAPVVAAVEETSASAETEAPEEPSSEPEETEAPVETTSEPEETEAPVETTSEPEETEAPVETTSEPEETEAAEAPAVEPTVSVIQETKAPADSETPMETTEAPEAPEETEAPVLTLETVSIVPQLPKDMPTDEELFAGYADRELFGTEPPSPLSNMGAQLEGDDKFVYDTLKSYIQMIASGKRASATIGIGIDVPQIPVQDQTGTVIGYQDFIADTAYEFTATEINATAIVDALLADLPYDLYWFDKTTGYNVFKINYTDGPLAHVSFNFTVADNYKGTSDLHADTEKTGAASTAAANALELTNGWAELSDYDKLVAFRDHICDTVEYDDYAADNGSYAIDNDPWQLIRVFDDNTENDLVVCEGYSKAFQYLCELSTFTDPTVECYNVTGYAGGPHMWNVVTIGDANYMVDLTNSDSGMIGQDGSFFLAGAESGSIAEGYTYANNHGQELAYLYSYEVEVKQEDGTTTTKTVEDALETYGEDVNSILNMSLEDYPIPSEGEEETGYTQAQLIADLGEFALTTDIPFALPESLTLTSTMTVEPGDLEMAEGIFLPRQFIVPEGVTLTVPNGVTLTLETCLFVQGGQVIIKDGGTVICNEELQVSAGDTDLPGTLTVEAGGSLETNSTVRWYQDGSQINCDTLSNVDAESIVTTEAELLEAAQFQVEAPFRCHSIYVDGSFTLNHNLSLPHPVNLVVTSDDTLTIASGCTLTTSSALVVQGNAVLVISEDAALVKNSNVSNYGIIANYGTVTGEGVMFGNEIRNIGDTTPYLSMVYLDWDENSALYVDEVNQYHMREVHIPVGRPNQCALALNVYDGTGYNWTTTYLDVRTLNFGEYLSSTAYTDMEGITIVDGEPVHVMFQLIADDAAGWDKTTSITYWYNDTLLTFPVYIERDAEAEFYSTATASNESYIHEYFIDPSLDENSFYFIITDEYEYLDITSVTETQYAEHFILDDLGSGVYKVTVEPGYVENCLGTGGFNMIITVAGTYREESIYSGEYNREFLIHCHAPDLDFTNQVHLDINDTGYDYLPNNDVWMADGQVTTRPEGVAYDYDTNTLTLTNATLDNLFTNYHWQERDEWGNLIEGGDEGYNLPNSDLTIQLVGENTIASSHRTPLELNDEINVTITGEGSLHIKATNSSENVDDGGNRYAFDAFCMYNDTSLTITGGAQVTVELAGMGFFGDEQAMLFGLSLNGPLCIENGSLTTVLPSDAKISGNTFVATDDGGSYPGGYRGINCRNITVSANGTLTTQEIFADTYLQTGGSVTVNAIGDRFYDSTGYWDNEQNAWVDTGMQTQYHYHGIQAEETLTVNGGTLEINLKPSTEELASGYCNFSGLTIEGGTMDLTGGTITINADYDGTGLNIRDCYDDNGNLTESSTLNFSGAKLVFNGKDGYVPNAIDLNPNSTMNVTSGSMEATHAVFSLGGVVNWEDAQLTGNDFGFRVDQTFNMNSGTITLGERSFFMNNAETNLNGGTLELTNAMLINNGGARIQGNAIVNITVDDGTSSEYHIQNAIYNGNYLAFDGSAQVTVTSKITDTERDFIPIYVDGTFHLMGEANIEATQGANYHPAMVTQGQTLINGGTLTLNNAHIGYVQGYDFSRSPDDESMLFINGGTLNANGMVAGILLNGPAHFNGGCVNAYAEGTADNNGESWPQAIRVEKFTGNEDGSGDNVAKLIINGGSHTLTAVDTSENEACSKALSIVYSPVEINGGTITANAEMVLYSVSDALDNTNLNDCNIHTPDQEALTITSREFTETPDEGDYFHTLLDAEGNYRTSVVFGELDLGEMTIAQLQSTLDSWKGDWHHRINTTLNEGETLTIGIDGTFYVDEGGTITVRSGATLVINSYFFVTHGNLIVEDGGKLITTNHMRRHFGTVYFEDGSEVEAVDGWCESPMTWGIEDTAAHLSTYWVHDYGDGLFMNEEEYCENRDHWMVPGQTFGQIFYLNEFDTDSKTWIRTPVLPGNLTAGENVSIVPLSVYDDVYFQPGEPNTEYFVDLIIAEDDAAWDTVTGVTYNHNGTELTFEIQIKRDTDGGFYNEATASNETYITQFNVNPAKAEHSFYFILTREDLTDINVYFNWGDDKVSLTQISDKVYKVTVLEDVVANILRDGGFDFNFQVEAIDGDGNGWSRDFGIWCVEEWPEAEDAFFQFDYTDYSYYAADGIWMVNPWDSNEPAYAGSLPEGISYDYSTNTLTLSNASLNQMFTGYHWQERDEWGNLIEGGDEGYNLPNADLKIELAGSNTITSTIGTPLELSDELNVTIQGEGSLYVKATNSIDNVDDNGNNFHFPAFGMYNDSRLTIAENAQVTVELEGIGYFEDQKIANLNAMNIFDLTMNGGSLTTVLPADAMREGIAMDDGEYHGGFGGIDTWNITVNAGTLTTQELYLDNFTQTGGTVNITGNPNRSTTEKWVWNEETQEDEYVGIVDHYHYDGIFTDTGTVSISGGTLNIDVTPTEEQFNSSSYFHGIATCVGQILISGGDINITGAYYGKALKLEGRFLEDGTLSPDEGAYLGFSGGNLTFTGTQGYYPELIHLYEYCTADFTGGTITASDANPVLGGKATWDGTVMTIADSVLESANDFTMTSGTITTTDIGGVVLTGNTEITGGTLDLTDSIIHIHNNTVIGGDTVITMDVSDAFREEFDGYYDEMIWIRENMTLTVADNASITVNANGADYLKGISVIGNYVQTGGNVNITANTAPAMIVHFLESDGSPALDSEGNVRHGNLYFQGGTMTVNGIGEQDVVDFQRYTYAEITGGSFNVNGGMFQSGAEFLMDRTTYGDGTQGVTVLELTNAYLKNWGEFTMNDGTLNITDGSFINDNATAINGGAVNINNTGDIPGVIVNTYFSVGGDSGWPLMQINTENHHAILVTGTYHQMGGDVYATSNTATMVDPGIVILNDGTLVLSGLNALVVANNPDWSADAPERGLFVYGGTLYADGQICGILLEGGNAYLSGGNVEGTAVGLIRTSTDESGTEVTTIRNGNGIYVNSYTFTAEDGSVVTVNSELHISDGVLRFSSLGNPEEGAEVYGMTLNNSPVTITGGVVGLGGTIPMQSITNDPDSNNIDTELLFTGENGEILTTAATDNGDGTYTHSFVTDDGAAYLGNVMIFNLITTDQFVAGMNAAAANGERYTLNGMLMLEYDVELTADVDIASGSQIIVPSDVILTIPKGYELKLLEDGSLTVEDGGALANFGTVTNYGGYVTVENEENYYHHIETDENTGEETYQATFNDHWYVGNTDTAGIPDNYLSVILDFPSEEDLYYYSHYSVAEQYRSIDITYNQDLTLTQDLYLNENVHLGFGGNEDYIPTLITDGYRLLVYGGITTNYANIYVDSYGGLEISGTMTLNRTYMAQNGQETWKNQISREGTLFINNGSAVKSNAAFMNYGGNLHVGFHKDADVEGPAGTLYIAEGAEFRNSGYANICPEGVVNVSGSYMNIYDGTPRAIGFVDDMYALTELHGQLNINNGGYLGNDCWISMGNGAELNVYSGGELENSDIGYLSLDGAAVLNAREDSTVYNDGVLNNGFGSVTISGIYEGAESTEVLAGFDGTNIYSIEGVDKSQQILNYTLTDSGYPTNAVPYSGSVFAQLSSAMSANGYDYGRVTLRGAVIEVTENLDIPENIQLHIGEVYGARDEIMRGSGEFAINEGVTVNIFGDVNVVGQTNVEIEGQEDMAEYVSNIVNYGDLYLNGNTTNLETAMWNMGNLTLNEATLNAYEHENWNDNYWHSFILNYAAIFINDGSVLNLDTGLISDGAIHVGFWAQDGKTVDGTLNIGTYGLVDLNGYLNVSAEGYVNIEGDMNITTSGFMENHGTVTVAGTLNNNNVINLDMDGSLDIPGTYNHGKNAVVEVFSVWNEETGALDINLCEDIEVGKQTLGHVLGIQFPTNDLASMRSAITAIKNDGYAGGNFLIRDGEWTMDTDFIQPGNVNLIIGNYDANISAKLTVAEGMIFQSDAPINVTAGGELILNGTMGNLVGELTVDENGKLTVNGQITTYDPIIAWEGSTVTNNGYLGSAAGSSKFLGTYNHGANAEVHLSVRTDENGDLVYPTIEGVATSLCTLDHIIHPSMEGNNETTLRDVISTLSTGGYKDAILGVVSTTLTLTDNLTIPYNATFQVGNEYISEGTLNIAEGKTLTNNGRLLNYSAVTMEANAKLVNNATLNGNGTYSGVCGDELTWNLADSVLTIAGSGDMIDYTTAPWCVNGLTVSEIVIAKDTGKLDDVVFADATIPFKVYCAYPYLADIENAGCSYELVHNLVDGECVDCEPAMPEITLSHYGQNLRLQDLIKIGYYFSMSTEAEVEEVGALLWTQEQYLSDVDHTVTSATAAKFENLQASGGYYIVETDGIYAQNLGDVYYMIPYAKTAQGYAYGEAKEYSALTYIQKVYSLDNAAYASLKSLVIDLVNYGTAARNYFCIAEGLEVPAEPFNSFLSEEDQQVSWSDELLVTYPDVDETGIFATTLYGRNVNLLDAISAGIYYTNGSSITNAYYWTEADYTASTVHDSTTRSGDGEVTDAGGNYAKVSINGLFAYNIYDNYYVRVSNASGDLSSTYSISVAGYLSQVVNAYASRTDETSVAFCNLSKAMLVYGNNAQSNPSINK